MPQNGGAWAIAEFDPVLSIRIVGFTKDEADAAKASASNEDSSVVGAWMREGIVSGTVLLLRSNDRYELRWKYKDGSSSRSDVTVKDTPDGKRIDRENAQNGEYYLINSQGDMESRDNDGLITVFKKIR